MATDKDNRPRGFTLVEMSLVLIVIGLVIVIVFPAMHSLRIAQQRAATHSALLNGSRAIAAFVQANGCLPCPTPAGTWGEGFGFVRGAAGGAPCAPCAVAEGIVPFASIGMQMSAVKDGWGRWLTLRIDPALAVNFGVAPPTAPCRTGDPAPCTAESVGQSIKGLCRAGLPTLGRISVKTPGGASAAPAAVMILSHGENGFGAFQASPLSQGQTNAHVYNGPAGACTATGGFERCNADDNAAFVAAEATTHPTAPFDDILLYMDRNALVSLLGNAACQTAW